MQSEITFIFCEVYINLLLQTDICCCKTNHIAHSQKLFSFILFNIRYTENCWNKICRNS